MKLLELFSGTASMSNVFKEYGHEAITVDRLDRCFPDITSDIMDFSLSDLPNGWKPDVVWASPPCEAFSVATIGRNWYIDYTPSSRLAREALMLVERTIDVVWMLNPKLWFIENPRGMLRKMSIMSELPRKTVTYCQYGDTRMKPTDIWTNSTYWKPRPMCKNGDSCHERAPRGSKTGTQGKKNATERGRIPTELCLEIMKSCEVESDIELREVK